MFSGTGVGGVVSYGKVEPLEMVQLAECAGLRVACTAHTTNFRGHSISGCDTPTIA